MRNPLILAGLGIWSLAAGTVTAGHGGSGHGSAHGSMGHGSLEGHIRKSPPDIDTQSSALPHYAPLARPSIRAKSLAGVGCGVNPLRR